MRISFKGTLVDEKEIRAGFIGCGSHSFRNIYPTFQFAPVNLVATCDIDIKKAEAFAAKFGAEKAYSNHKEMLERDDLDAIFIVTGYNEKGRPQFPVLAADCLNAGKHVWIEKPPAATSAEIEMMQKASKASGKNVVVGMKKMFFTANEKAKALMDDEAFGKTSLVMLQYPQKVPTVDEFKRYLEDEERVPPVISFLDHLVHPMSLLVYLMGMPKTLFYERSHTGSGMATFTYDGGVVASIALSGNASRNGGMERTMIVGDKGTHISVENNFRVTFHQNPPFEPGTGYGSSPSFYTGPKEEASAVWEPEVSLGQLYNKGLFLLGYYGEVNEFARSILEKRPPAKGTLEQAWQCTRVFEGFAEGPGKAIEF
jgi:predicted dehydrogenase